MGVLFLELNGLTFTATQADAAETVLALAAGRVSEDGLCHLSARQRVGKVVRFLRVATAPRNRKTATSRPRSRPLKQQPGGDILAP